MRWFALLALALAVLLAGCMQSGSNSSSTPPHTFSTTTPPSSTSGTSTSMTTSLPPAKIAILEITGWVNGTGPYSGSGTLCDPIAGARVDFPGKTLHVPAGTDAGNQLRLVVFDRSKSVDNASDGAPECRPNVLAGYASGVQNYTWKIETASGWVAGDRVFKLQPGTSTLAVDNLLLPVGKPRAVPVSFVWDRYDGAHYDYNGTLWLTYHGEWPRSALQRDFMEHRLGLAADEAVWKPEPPIA